VVRVLTGKDGGNLLLEICSNMISSHESKFIVGTSRFRYCTFMWVFFIEFYGYSTECVSYN